MKLSNRLRDLRLDKKLSQSDIAKILNISTSAYGFYEQGKSIPNATTLNTLANLYNVSVDYLMGKSNIKNPYELIELPNEFDSPEEAIKFILEQPALMDYGGYSLNDMAEEEILDLANDLLFAMKLSLEKRKKK